MSPSTATAESATTSARGLRRRETAAAFGFLSPWIVGFLVFTGGPMLATLVLSMTSYDVISSPEWVGLANYRDAMTDPDVRLVLSNTFVYTALNVPLSLLVALGLALLLDRAGRASGFFRTVFYLPVITPPVATGILFLLLLNGQDGLINEVLGALGLPTPYWTSDPTWIKPGLVIMSLWTVGGTTIIYLAALREVPVQLYEAAEVDGASARRRFLHVTLPMISGAILFTLIVNTIASMQLFTEVYTMYFDTSTADNPDAALFYVVYLFQQGFQFLHMGYASALAWVLFLVILVLTAIQVRLSMRLVYYRGN